MATFILSAFADEAGASVEEQIDALKANGIRYIEPRSIGDRGILTLSEEELANIEQKLTENGIKTSSLGSPIGKYGIDDDFDEYLTTFEKALRACEILGTDKMRMFSFFVPQEQLGEKREEVIRRLNVMTEMAAKRNITLCHENESLIYGQMPEQVKDLLINVKNLKGIFDPANYRMNDADVIDGINATLINFAYLHIKDAIYSEQCILPAGEGEGKIGEVLELVNKKIDGEVFLTVEPHLFEFMAYKSIDSHTLKNKYSFKNNRESFDFAVGALKKLLTDLNYREDENGIWKK